MRMLATNLRSKPVSRTSHVNSAAQTVHSRRASAPPSRLGASIRMPVRWYAEADTRAPLDDAAPVILQQPPHITTRDASTLNQPAMPDSSADNDPINSLLRVLFRSVYDQLPLNTHYTVVEEAPNDYTLLYKHGFHLLQVTCKVAGLEHITLPLNQADEMRVLESRAALKQMVATMRAQPLAFYTFSLEGVHLMRLEKDPFYKPLAQKPDVRQTGSPTAVAPAGTPQPVRCREDE